jgi:CheY-like chemotaxis protein
VSSILFAHAQPAIARVVEAVLGLYGFDVHTVRTGDEARELLGQRRFDALVIDVAVTGTPAFELVSVAKSLAQQPDHGAPVVVFVSSVYRKTSYKRRPARLYGADDYVEIHHLADMLPGKLAKLLAIDAQVDGGARVDAESKAATALRLEADRRVESYDADEMAALVVADVLLYNGDGIADTASVDEARAAVSEDLDVARDLLEQLARASGVPVPADDPVGRAFERLFAEWRTKGATS